VPRSWPHAQLHHMSDTRRDNEFLRIDPHHMCADHARVMTLNYIRSRRSLEDLGEIVIIDRFIALVRSSSLGTFDLLEIDGSLPARSALLGRQAPSVYDIFERNSVLPHGPVKRCALQACICAERVLAFP